MTPSRPAPGRSPRSIQLPRLIPFLLLLLAACAAPPPEGSADIRVALQAVTSSDVSRVTLTISASDLSPSLVSELQNAGGGTFKAIIGGIPAGTNRTFVAQAFNASNVKLYEGQATGVTISTGGPASVLILLQQSTPSIPFVNSAPRLTGLIASASQVKPGQTVTLTATATDADGDALGYAWTASGGALSSASVASPTWTAPSTEGTYTLSVSVTDGRGGQAGVSLKLAVVGDRGSASVSVSFNAWPVVSQVMGTPGQVAPGGSVNLSVSAVEPDGDALVYSWADDCGGGFSSASVKNPVWTAPVTAPTGGVCKVTVTVSDKRGGNTTGQLGLGVGLPSPSNAAPVIDKTYQSNNLVSAGNTVSLNVDAYDPEGTPLTFTWSASGGSLGTPTTSATHSEVIWTAPTQPNPYTITVVVQDAGGQKTTQSFAVDFGLQTCVRVVTSYKKITTNPYGAALNVAYSMAGGGGGGDDWAGQNGARVSGTLTLAVSPNLEIFVGGGGGAGEYYSGAAGSGGAGYYGGGAAASGCGGGGGSSAILSGGTLVNVAAGGRGGGGYTPGLEGGGGSTTGGTAGADRYNTNPTAGSLYTGGHNSVSSGGSGANGGSGTSTGCGGGGYGGGGSSGSLPGGSSGANGGNSTATVGLGANTWSTATTLPDAAGASTIGGGNAGLVILTYSALSCLL